MLNGIHNTSTFQ